ncbi:MAG: WD40/YVTN/BNR-like repeat-containing protein, partial [Candidatus Geothermincolia bacterium]
PAELKNDGAVEIKAVDTRVLWAVVSIMKTGQDDKFGLIMKSTDSGATWNQAAPTLYPALGGIAVTDGGQTIVACGDAGTMVRSVDGGATWRLDKVPTRNDLNSVSGPDQGNMWVAGSYGSILKIVAPTLTSASPGSGNDSMSRLPMTLRGSGFVAGLKVELVHGDERLQGTSVSVVSTT